MINIIVCMCICMFMCVVYMEGGMKVNVKVYMGRLEENFLN